MSTTPSPTPVRKGEAETKHTPGPFKAKEYQGKAWVEGKGRAEVCVCEQMDTFAENYANAVRIAHALNAMDKRIAADGGAA